MMVAAVVRPIHEGGNARRDDRQAENDEEYVEHLSPGVHRKQVAIAHRRKCGDTEVEGVAVREALKEVEGERAGQQVAKEEAPGYARLAQAGLPSTDQALVCLLLCELVQRGALSDALES